jgi:hypothetical protein
MDQLERDICRFVSETVGVQLDRVHLRSTLGKDLGVDGDDAIEFFDAYSLAFHVDVTALQAKWSEFFGPEGLGAGQLIMLVPFAVAAILLFSVGWMFGLQPRADLALVIIAIVGGVLMFPWRHISFWPYEKLFSLPKQITVAELIEAARRGRWQ